MKEHLLDTVKAFSFFKENLSQVNALSNAVLELLQTQHGSFYAFLPDSIPPDKIHDFNAGGKTSSLREEISFKLASIINSKHSLNCIFDDFNSSLDSVNNNDLYQSLGIHYLKEIYYKIVFGVDQKTVLKCLNYSSTIWHSLCIVFDDNINIKKEMSKFNIENICKNAIFIMIEAYDSESYIYWCNSEGVKILKNLRL